MSQGAVADHSATPAEWPAKAPDSPPAGDGAREGGSRELLTLALPLVVSQSFMTVQVFVDTVLLAWHDPREMAASFPAVMWFWLPFGLLQVTAGYVSTFVAQYTGAGRPERVGPAVWQGIHFAVMAGLLFLLMVPAAPTLIAIGGHTRPCRRWRWSTCVAWLRGLADAGHGRGQRLLLRPRADLDRARDRGRRDGVNVALALVLIFGRAGFPELGIAGAGWATVAGSWASAAGRLALLLRAEVPRGVQHAGRLAAGAGAVRPAAEVRRAGRDAGLPRRAGLSRVRANGGPARRGGAGATTLTVRLNMVAFLPMMGMGQAVSILVGQRLGADRPDLAERSAYTGLRWVFGYMCVRGRRVSALPGRAGVAVRGRRDPESSRRWPRSCRPC